MKRIRLFPLSRIWRAIAGAMLALLVGVGLAIGSSPARVSATAASAWTSVVPDMPTPRVNLGAAAGLDGRIYAVGGIVPGGPNNQGVAVNTVEAYDPSTGAWATNLNPMPTARTEPAVTAGLDGRIYAIGGYLPPPANFYVNNVEAYDPATNTWSTLAPMPTARGGLVAATGSDGRIYAIGGENNSFLTTVEIYDPKSDSWTTNTAATPIAQLPHAHVARGGSRGP